MTDEQKVQEEIIQYIDPSLLPAGDMETFREGLTAYIHDLINNDFHRLVFILYRLDINEKRLTEILADKQSPDAGQVIANLIIERQLQKMELRKQFKEDASNIPEEDRW